MPQQKATTTAADGGGKEVAPQSFMQNGCFLCSTEIGEAEPRQFYAGPPGATGVMMLAHTGCLNKFMANGEQWPEEQQKEAKISPLGDVHRAVFGMGRVAYNDYRLVLLCEDKIAEKGLKAVLPDLIDVLKAVEQTL